MTISNHIRTFPMATASLLASLLLAAAAQPLKIDFSSESVGTEPKSFLSVVGVWRIEAEGDNKVLVVDGNLLVGERANGAPGQHKHAD